MSIDNNSYMDSEINELDIAIVSISCRFPGANNPDAFWQNLRDGVESVTFFSDDELTLDDESKDTLADRIKAGAVLDDVDLFDAAFFGYSAKEAESMDPQQRLFLECAWEALEAAGYDSEYYDGLIGVYSGSGVNTYWLNNVLPNQEFTPNHSHLETLHDLQLMLANEKDFLPTRTSYKLNLMGPSLNVQTACSTSLVAVHLACQSLLNGECDMALAGGVSIRVPQKNGYLYQPDMLFSPDGHCRAFDADAQGTVFGNGVGIVVLKLLQNAIDDGDSIHAVIKGSAINNDGALKVSYSAPGIDGQSSVIASALAAADVNADTISYIEAHGTGTHLGDPVEITALTQAFRQTTERNGYCAIGSVKTNIGHLAMASGIAGLIKAILALKHKQIPPSLHYSRPNPQINFEKTPFYVNSQLTDWSANGTPRRAGVSSFGMGGANAHIVLEEAPERIPQQLDVVTDRRSHHILTLSAKSEQALQDATQLYAEYLKAHPEINLDDICHTTHVGRRHFAYRIAIVAESAEHMHEQLQALPEQMAGVVQGYVQGRRLGVTPIPANTSQKIGFLFTGQGAQYVNMGRDLYESQSPATEPFRAALDRCAEILHAHLDCSLIELLYPANRDKEGTIEAATALLNQTAYTQPALFAVEYALCKLWQSWGIQPDVVMGHSVGEYVAACVAGVFSLEDGLKLIAARGRLMQALPQEGEMVSFLANEAQVYAAITKVPDYAQHVSIAAVNGPESVVISGKREPVLAIAEQLTAEGIKARRVTVSHAFHSPLMEPILADFRQVAESVHYNRPQMALISNVTGKVVDDEVALSSYWVRHIREAVRFADGVVAMQKQGVGLFLEAGPKPTLLGMAKSIIQAQQNGDAPAMLPSIRDNQSNWQTMLESLGMFYARGIEIDWAQVDVAEQRRKVVLPTYPFQRQRYWIETPKRRHSVSSLRPLIEKITKLPLHKETVFESQFSVETLPFLADHLVYETVVSPGACQLSMVLSAAELMFAQEKTTTFATCLENVVLPQTLAIPDGKTRTVQVVYGLINEYPAKYEFQVISFDADIDNGTSIDAPAIHATGHLVPSTVGTVEPESNVDALRQRCDQPYELDTFYEAAATIKVDLGPSFRWLTELWYSAEDSKTELLGKLVAPTIIDSVAGHMIHPGLLDACFQIASIARIVEGNNETLLPFTIRLLNLYQSAHSKNAHSKNVNNNGYGGGDDMWWCHAVEREPHKWDIRLLSAEGSVIATLEGFELRVASAEAIHGNAAWKDWLYNVTWKPQPYFGLPPNYLQIPATLIKPLREMTASLWTEKGGERYQTMIDELEALSIDYVLAAFAKVGVLFHPNTLLNTETLAEQLGVISAYQRLLERLLAMLAEEGILQQDKNGWRVVHSPRYDNPSLRIITLKSRYGNTPELTLLSRCGEKLSEVLRGAQDPLELLFPGGDTSVATRLYTESPNAQVMNALVQTTIQNIVDNLPDERGLHILEIGAGTGGTTASLLPLLPAERTDYLFTDIGPAFLSRAKENFSEYGFIRYRPLNIEESPTEQGFERHQADVIVAANVIHATQNLPETLTNVRSLLQPGGQLIMLEATSRRRWIDLTFGYTDGWWRFADQREGHPLLSNDQWDSVLHKNGFELVEITDIGGQAIIVAQVADLTSKAASSTGRTWLLFADQQGTAEALAAQMQMHGETPLLVYTGDEYQESKDISQIQTVTIRPDMAVDYQRLLATFTDTHTDDIHGIIHLWSLDTPHPTIGADLVKAAQQNCGTVLNLVQALLQSNIEPAGLWLVTKDAQAAIESSDSAEVDTTGHLLTGVAQSGLWGMGKVITLEHPELNCVRVDLDNLDTPTAQSCHLWAEISATATPVTHSAAKQGQLENQVALRADGRYVARMQKYQPTKSDPLPPTTTIQSEATYLITGGLNGLGLAVAKWLVEQGANHLLLTGRSQPKPEAQVQLDALRDMGVTITIAHADVTDRSQMIAAFGQIEPDYPLLGVIHSAGVLDDGAILQQDWGRIAKVLAPKMQGAWLLHELTADMPLDFFVLFSSMAGLLGNAGQPNHAAANAFLDAFSHYRQAQGLTSLSINWGPWSEIGSAADLVQTRGKQLAAQGMGSMSTQQGIDAFAYLLDQPVPQTGVIPVKWPLFLTDANAENVFYTNFIRVLQAELAEENVQESNSVDDVPASIRTQLTDAKPEKRSMLLVHYLQTEVTRVLGIRNPEQIDPRLGLLDMGLDSLMAIDLRNKLARALEQSLPSILIFDYPTINALSAYLLGELGLDEADTVDTVDTIDTVSLQSNSRLMKTDTGSLQGDLPAQLASDELYEHQDALLESNDEILEKLQKLDSLLKK